VTADLKELGLVWAKAEKIARDSEKWRTNVVMALCLSGEVEDECVTEGVKQQLHLTMQRRRHFE